ncbi:hypothetical protein ACLOJK_038727 [Asimina triloba]
MMLQTSSGDYNGDLRSQILDLKGKEAACRKPRWVLAFVTVVVVAYVCCCWRRGDGVLTATTLLAVKIAAGEDDRRCVSVAVIGVVKPAAGCCMPTTSRRTLVQIAGGSGRVQADGSCRRNWERTEGK